MIDTIRNPVCIWRLGMGWKANQECGLGSECLTAIKIKKYRTTILLTQKNTYSSRSLTYFLRERSKKYVPCLLTIGWSHTFWLDLCGEYDLLCATPLKNPTLIIGLAVPSHLHFCSLTKSKLPSTLLPWTQGRVQCTVFHMFICFQCKLFGVELCSMPFSVP